MGSESSQPSRGDSVPEQNDPAGDDDSDAVPSDTFALQGGVAPETLRACAALDQSDTDNGKRLRLYFGDDLHVIAEEGSVGGVYLNWCGTHWDIAEGAAGVHMMA